MSANGILSIFDEVVTGFRCAPGGAQEAYGITLDLTTMAKFWREVWLWGGRRTEGNFGELILKKWLKEGVKKIQHPGTFNANPVSATAGITALKIIERTDACQRANEFHHG